MNADMDKNYTAVPFGSDNYLFVFCCLRLNLFLKL